MMMIKYRVIDTSMSDFKYGEIVSKYVSSHDIANLYINDEGLHQWVLPYQLERVILAINNNIRIL